MTRKTLTNPAELAVPAVPPISPPSASDDWPKARWDALHRELRAIQTACQSNKADEAMAMITVCISEGADTAGLIIGALQPFGYARPHVGAMLTQGKKPYWRKNSAGRFELTEHHPQNWETGDVSQDQPASA